MKIHFAVVKIFGTYVEDEDSENKNMLQVLIFKEIKRVLLRVKYWFK